MRGWSKAGKGRDRRAGRALARFLGVALALSVTALLVVQPSGAASCNAVTTLLGCQPDPSPPPPPADDDLPAGPNAPDPGGIESVDQPVPAPGKLFGWNTTYWEPNRAVSVGIMNAATQIGGTLLRNLISWEDLQPRESDPSLPSGPDNPPGSDGVNQPRLKQLDNAYLAMAARGAHPVIVADRAPLWATRYASCESNPITQNCRDVMASPLSTKRRSNVAVYPDEPHYDAFAAFMIALVSRYDGAVVQPLNEFDQHKDTPTGISPEVAAQLQCGVYDRIKAANPSAIVLMTPINDWNARSRFVSRAARLHPKGEPCWDHWTMHLYLHSKPNMFGAGSDFATRMQEMRRMRRQLGDTTSMWVTETGFSTTGSSPALTEAEAADLQRRLYNRLATMEDVEAVLVHTVRDGSYTYDANHPESGYGLLRSDQTPKPAYCHLVFSHAGATWPGCVPPAPDPAPDPEPSGDPEPSTDPPPADPTPAPDTQPGSDPAPDPSDPPADGGSEPVPTDPPPGGSEPIEDPTEQSGPPAPPAPCSWLAAALHRCP